MTRPVFGQAVDSALVESTSPRAKSGTLKSNPCASPFVFGPGPSGVTCSMCAHLRRVGGTAGRYWKCALRRNTSGAATDHRVRWPACGRYEMESEP